MNGATIIQQHLIPFYGSGTLLSWRYGIYWLVPGHEPDNIGDFLY